MNQEGHCSDQSKASLGERTCQHFHGLFHPVQTLAQCSHFPVQRSNFSAQPLDTWVPLLQYFVDTLPSFPMKAIRSSSSHAFNFRWVVAKKSTQVVGKGLWVVYFRATEIKLAES